MCAEETRVFRVRVQDRLPSRGPENAGAADVRTRDRVQDRRFAGSGRAHEHDEDGRVDLSGSRFDEPLEVVAKLPRVLERGRRTRREGQPAFGQVAKPTAPSDELIRRAVGFGHVQVRLNAR